MFKLASLVHGDNDDDDCDENDANNQCRHCTRIVGPGPGFGFHVWVGVYQGRGAAYLWKTRFKAFSWSQL